MALHLTAQAFTPTSFLVFLPILENFLRQSTYHHDHQWQPFWLVSSSKSLLVFPVVRLPGCSSLTYWLLTLSRTHSLPLAPPISLITAMKAVQTKDGIRTNQGCPGWVLASVGLPTNTDMQTFASLSPAPDLNFFSSIENKLFRFQPLFLILNLHTAKWRHFLLH